MDIVFTQNGIYMVTLLIMCSDKLSETTFIGNFWEVIKNLKSTRAPGGTGQIG